MKDITKHVQHREIPVRINNGLDFDSNQLTCQVNAKIAVEKNEKKEKEREKGVLGMEGHYAECYPG